ncbi:MAG: protein kinase domain-containing protein [Candidatus Zhuqueibacterota bacterium]
MEKPKQNDDQRVIDLLYQLGTTYLEKGDYDNAIDKFKKLIQLGELNAKIFLTLSKAYILKEQFDQEALNVFEAALKYEPANPVLNVVLSQIYLNMNKEDALACQVFKNALQHNPPNSSVILTRLIHIHIQKNDIAAVREYLTQLIPYEDALAGILPRYVKLEWKNDAFDAVSNFFQLLIERTQNREYYPWLISNYMHRLLHETGGSQISNTELTHYRQYFSNFEIFQRLFDLYLYIFTENILSQKAIEKNKKKDSQSIEEFELFLAEDSFSNIWERGLNIQNKAAGTNRDLFHSDLWCKLNLWLNVNGSEGPVSEASAFEKSHVRQILKKAKAVVMVHGEGQAFSSYQNQLREALTRDYDRQSDFLLGAAMKDGSLIFTHDIKKSVDNVIHFLQGISTRRNGNAEAPTKFQILVHKLSASKSEEEMTLLHELQMLLSGFEFEKKLLLEPKEGSVSGDYQLFITAPVEKLLKKIYPYSIIPVENRLFHPLTPEPAPIFQVHWNDNLSKIQRGDVKSIGRFKILKELQPNGVFTSFRAMDTSLERLVVLKILRPDFIITDSNISTGDLFMTETRLLGKLHHPNIAMIYDVGKAEDFYFLAREYVEGSVLSTPKAINNKINWQRSLRICLNIMETLEAIHQKNIYHGKLEPNNIFITNGSDVKITDFQIQHFFVLPESYSKSHIKSLAYFAPEKLENLPATAQSDIYSMGVILYELLTEHNPFDAATRNDVFKLVRNTVPAPVSSLNNELPKQLDDIVSKMVAKSVADRYNNLSEIKKELASFLQNPGK